MPSFTSLWRCLGFPVCLRSPNQGPNILPPDDYTVCVCLIKQLSMNHFGSSVLDYMPEWTSKSISVYKYLMSCFVDGTTVSFGFV